MNEALNWFGSVAEKNSSQWGLVVMDKEQPHAMYTYTHGSPLLIGFSHAEDQIFVVSEKGNGKRSPLEDYRITNRGGKGVKTISITEKTGKLVALKWVSEFDDLMTTTVDGISALCRLVYRHK